MSKRKIFITIIILFMWGLLIRPPVTGGRLSSPWGLRFTTDRLFHPGSDIALPTGSPIYPIAPGTVRETGFNERIGNYMIIDHLPAIQSRYLHFDTMNSQAGNKVEYKTIIGTVGNTGSISTGPHIHWEIRVFNIPLPAYLLCLPGRLLQRINAYVIIDRFIANNT